MAKIGQDTSPLVPPRTFVLPALLGLVFAGIPALFFRGFEIDDAWIPVRYARHLAMGAGYRFNLGDAPSDGVTPLPYPFILAPLAHADARTVLERARWLGILAYALTGVVVGLASWMGSPSEGSRRGNGGRWRTSVLPLVPLLFALPSAIHSTSGLETGLATLLFTLAAALFERALASPLAGGLAATLRPELLPACLALACVRALRDGRPRDARVVNRALPIVTTLAPFTLVALVRELSFGRPTPLSVLAKPSDLEHGALYAAASILLASVPALAIPAKGAPPRAHAIFAAFVVHTFSVVLVGGDWMPYARLFAPILPALVVGWGDFAPSLSPRGIAARLVPAIVSFLLMARTTGPARSTGAARERLIGEAQPIVAGRKVASLDVGWLTAVTESRVVDLAGLTDPAFARLPGGHTSKRIDGHLLLERDFELLLLLADAPPEDPARFWDAPFSRVVEARLARDPAVQDAFVLREELSLGKWTYLVLERRM